MRTMNLCARCERHVYADEARCPFCAASGPRVRDAGRSGDKLARAAGYAAGAVLLMGVGCSESFEPSADAGPSVDAFSPEPVDAHVPPPDARDGVDAAVADAGAPSDGGQADAADSEVPIPLYGGAFPDPRRRAVV